MFPAFDEIHWHVEGVVNISLETHAQLECPWQHAGAIGIGVAPDFRAEREKAVGLAFGKWRIGENGGGHWLERERNPQLLHHVGFAGVVEAGVHPAGAIHPVEAVFFGLWHISGHSLVEALWRLPE